MFKNFQKYSYLLTTGIYALLALLFFGVLLKSFGYDAVKMWVYSPKDGNLRGLMCGFAAYAIFLFFLVSPKIHHNLTWFMHFTHEIDAYTCGIAPFQKDRGICGFQKRLPCTLSEESFRIYTDYIVSLLHSYIHVHAFPVPIFRSITLHVCV